MGAKIAVIVVVVGLLTLVEKLFALREQPSWWRRPGVRADVLHFLVSNVLAQAGLVITIGLLFGLLAEVVSDDLQRAVAAQPAWLQFIEAVLVTDLSAYVVHRLGHAVPALWRFHRIHHSSEQLDWLASVRVHPVDIILVRSAQFGPLFLLGFTRETFGAYAAFLSVWAFVLHANVKWRFGPLRFVLATPQFHHWHHARDERAVNFAGQLPILDLVFGTLHVPAGRWPERYGVDDGPVPERWAEQLTSPFRPTRESSS